MAEAPDVDLESIHETIRRTEEHEGGRFLRNIALSTALLAALAAVAALQAGATVNEALVLQTESTRLQAEASDQWAYYQAKGIKAAVQEASRESWVANNKVPPPAFQQTAERYAHEQEGIKQDAEAKERERDNKVKQAERLLARHHGYANAVALFQIAIALGAVSALTRSRKVWLGSIVSGAAAAVLFVLQMGR